MNVLYKVIVHQVGHLPKIISYQFTIIRVTQKMQNRIITKR